MNPDRMGLADGLPHDFPASDRFSPAPMKTSTVEPSLNLDLRI